MNCKAEQVCKGGPLNEFSRTNWACQLAGSVSVGHQIPRILLFLFVLFCNCFNLFHKSVAKASFMWILLSLAILSQKNWLASQITVNSAVHKIWNQGLEDISETRQASTYTTWLWSQLMPDCIKEQEKVEKNVCST